MLPLFPHEQPCVCCFTLLFLSAILYLMYQMVKMLWYHSQESTASIPPGTCGLPLIGETLQFMASINSGKGFYDFVRIRGLR
jgi:hypothetical protein